MNNIFHIPLPSRYGLIGVFIYYALSLPFLRELLFSKGVTILSRFSGELNSGLDTFSFLAQLTLVVPYSANEYVFKYFDIGDLNILVLAIFTPIVYRYFSLAVSQISFLILVFIFIPVPLQFLSTFTKEVILILFLYMAYGVNSQFLARKQHLIFFGYVMFMKLYLVWIPVMLYLDKIRNLLIALIIVFFITSFIPIVGELVYAIFNRRMVESSFIANSEIIQTVYVSDLRTMLMMLYEVIPQIYFPFFIEPSLKTLFFQTYILFFISLCLYFRNRYSTVLLGVMLLHTILDPDLGAFIRHLSTFFLFVPLMMGLHENAEIHYMPNDTRQP